MNTEYFELFFLPLPVFLMSAKEDWIKRSTVTGFHSTDLLIQNYSCFLLRRKRTENNNKMEIKKDPCSKVGRIAVRISNMIFGAEKLSLKTN